MLVLLLGACDFYRKNKCEWYLVPEPDHIDRVEPGWVSLCARNYQNNKQRCNLKAKLPFAKKVYGKPFRYASMKIKSGPFPKEVESVTLCEP
ncbi:MAG: hypothetical protein ACOH5I_12845 [Oligoflexus sp.]